MRTGTGPQQEQKSINWIRFFKSWTPFLPIQCIFMFLYIPISLSAGKFQMIWLELLQCRSWLMLWNWEMCFHSENIKTSSLKELNSARMGFLMFWSLETMPEIDWSPTKICKLILSAAPFDGLHHEKSSNRSSTWTKNRYVPFKSATHWRLENRRNKAGFVSCQWWRKLWNRNLAQWRQTLLYRDT